MFLTEKKKKKKKKKSIFRKHFLNVSEKFPSKFLIFLFKVHLNNKKLQSNTANPEYKKSTSLFFYPNAQKQSRLFFNLETAEITIVTS